MMQSIKIMTYNTAEHIQEHKHHHCTSSMIHQAGLFFLRATKIYKWLMMATILICYYNKLQFELLQCLF